MDEASYAIKEVFKTLQGEGARAGTVAVFVRFVGCNAWGGAPEHRERDHARTGAACARWCDTDFRKEGSEILTARELRARIEALWASEKRDRWVVLTGGEPMLQLDDELMGALTESGPCWNVAVETNGSVAPKVTSMRGVIDHLTVSPKRGLPLITRSTLMQAAHTLELKVVLPGRAVEDTADAFGWTDEELRALFDTLRPDRAYVQPQDPIDHRFVEVSHLHRPEREDGTRTPFLYESVERGDQYRANVKRCVDFVMAHPEWRLGLQSHKFLGLR